MPTDGHRLGLLLLYGSTLSLHHLDELIPG
jgi:hypothetical protein